MRPFEIQDRGYAHPELLAETDWLAVRLTDPKVQVIDARQRNNTRSTTFREQST
jgi:hypothetical protein